MAWTQNDIDALKAAIAKGVRDVSYGQNRVSYRDLDEMRETLRMMQAEVSGRSRVRVIKTYTSRGF